MTPLHHTKIALLVKNVCLSVMDTRFFGCRFKIIIGDALRASRLKKNYGGEPLSCYLARTSPIFHGSGSSNNTW